MAINDKQTLNYFLEWARGEIVEYILSLCLRGATLDDFLDWMSVLSPTVVKKYLFYLIKDRWLKQMYLIEGRGLEILSAIMEEKVDKMH